MLVDHRNPICDQFCRCRACKPAAVQEMVTPQDARRMIVTAWLCFLFVFLPLLAVYLGVG